jgi:predicted transcriptional regulator
MKELTKAEEQVIQILWDIERGFVKDIIEHFSNPRPAYNTVSTICRILEKKGFLDHKVYGNSHQYHPVISRDEYTRDYLNNVVRNYFSNSLSQLVSFFSKQNKVNINEAERIIELMSRIQSSKKITNE